eukprot:XP_011683183.1 PREDICTED: ribonuclease Oy isoform X2 [Strongylocentrotus purpuratus]
MARFSILLLLVAIAYVHTSEGRSFEEFLRQVWEEADYDKLTLVYQWGPSFCENGRCTIPNTAKKIWTIHGLWPFKSNVKSSPIDCPGTYDSSAISSIQTTLNEKWPSYKTGGTNDELWKHEYIKHGTCASDLTTFNSQLKYFQGTTDLYDKYDIKKILADGDNAVAPSNNLKYPLAYITSALKKGLGVDPNVFCVEKKTVQYLFEVRLCFDKTLKPITCGSALVGGGQCNPLKKVVYPPFDSYITTKSLQGASDDLAFQFLLDVVEMGAREMMMTEEEEDDGRPLLETLFNDMWEKEE